MLHGTFAFVVLTTIEEPGPVLAPVVMPAGKTKEVAEFKASGELRLLAAARFGRARLLDNTGVTVQAPT